jgi:hypothetical protein
MTYPHLQRVHLSHRYRPPASARRLIPPALDVDVGLVHLHGGSSGGESSLIWWEEKGRLSGRGHQDRVTVAKKKCGAFKAERHRDDNEVTILGRLNSLLCPSWTGTGRCAGCVGTLRVCASRDFRLGCGVNRDAGAEAEVGVLEDRNGGDASAAAS